MFDDGFDEEVRAAVAAGDLRLDGPSSELGGPFDALSDAELAWLRDRPLPDPVAAVLAAGVAEPVTGHLVARLEAVDPAALDDDGRVAYALAWQRVANAALARRADAVSVLAAEQPGNDWVDPARAAAAELGAALALGSGAADRLVEVSMLLTARLSRTLAAASRGDLSWDKAVTLAEQTAPLSDDHARTVEDRVLPGAARRTPARHRDAVRRAVDRVDPEGARRRREQARADIRLVAIHHGAGMGRLFATLPAEQLDTVWTAADLRARNRKAAGDPRSLDVLRVTALVEWAESFLAHGDPTAGDRAEPSDTRPVTRHGRAGAVRVLWDLSSLLGVTEHCGELAASGATLAPDTMRELLARGARVRRMLVDTDGELVDLTPCSWVLAPAQPSTSQLPPVQLGLVVDADTRTALLTGDLEPLDPARRRVAERLADLLPLADPALTALLASPVTAESLDDDPYAERPSAALAEFVAVRDRHPVNPTAGPTDAAAADLDHTVPRSRGGKTVRDNLTSLVRRWHIARTHGGWTYRRVGRHWEWTSPTGLTYRTGPYDYRLGP